MRKLLVLSILFIGIFYSCDETVELPTGTLIVGDNEYYNYPNDAVTIESASVKGDILTIEYSAYGCNGNTWDVILIDADKVAESNPPRRSLRLSLDNDEACGSSVTKTLTFDITELRVAGNSVYLDFYGYDEAVLYEY